MVLAGQTGKEKDLKDRESCSKFTFVLRYVEECMLVLSHCKSHRVINLARRRCGPYGIEVMKGFF